MSQRRRKPRWPDSPQVENPSRIVPKKATDAIKPNLGGDTAYVDALRKQVAKMERNNTLHQGECKTPRGKPAKKKEDDDAHGRDAVHE